MIIVCYACHSLDQDKYIDWIICLSDWFILHIFYKKNYQRNFIFGKVKTETCCASFKHLVFKEWEQHWLVGWLVVITGASEFTSMSTRWPLIQF
jgi:hypothetical protein